MLDLRNVVISNLNNHKGMMARFVKMKSLLDAKCAANLRLLATKNNINRASDYHYLVLAVTQSTEPVNGIDYIHPSVKPVVDYATAVIAKGLMPSGEINFEFVPQDETDGDAARQATEMVSKVVNQMNDPHFILERWIMDACMHKNGMMMIKPVREQITRYVETQGTREQLKAFELQAEESGLTVLRQGKRRINVDMVKVAAEIQQLLGKERSAMLDQVLDRHIELLREGEGADTESLPQEAEEINISDNEIELR